MVTGRELFLQCFHLCLEKVSISFNVQMITVSTVNAYPSSQTQPSQSPCESAPHPADEPGPRTHDGVDLGNIGIPRDIHVQEKAALCPTSQRSAREDPLSQRASDRTFVDVDDLPAQLRIDHDDRIRRQQHCSLSGDVESGIKRAGWDSALQDEEVKLEMSSGVVGDVGPVEILALFFC